jgi:hypothetical protein
VIIHSSNVNPAASTMTAEMVTVRNAGQSFFAAAAWRLLGNNLASSYIRIITNRWSFSLLLPTPFHKLLILLARAQDLDDYSPHGSVPCMPCMPAFASCSHTDTNLCVIVYSLEKMFGGTEFHLVIYRTFESWMLTSHSISNLSRINKYTSSVW